MSLPFHDIGGSDPQMLIIFVEQNGNLPKEKKMSIFPDPDEGGSGLDKCLLQMML
jgi:hypothetical protein